MGCYQQNPLVVHKYKKNYIGTIHINHKCDEKLELGQKRFIHVCREVQRLYVLNSKCTKERTIHLCLLYHSHGGKKQCSYCVIGRHKSRGCELANPVTHHNGCYVCDKETPRYVSCAILKICGSYLFIYLFI